jgi:anti-sigma-K factor RskA
MSDVDGHSALPDDELIAAEYALGVLSGADRAAAERRIVNERAFARLVSDWEQRLAPWASEIAEATPPAQMWNRIAAALPPERTQTTGLWQSLAFWRTFGLASAFAAACLALVIYAGALRTGQPLMAAIDGGGHHHFVATLDTKRGTVAVVPAAFAGDVSGRVPELWLIPADGKPRALGLLRADGAVSIAIPSDLAPLAVKDAVLAVSLEPAGGSPTGQPTGPVIGSGKLASL